jgi:hypothetical protein
VYNLQIQEQGLTIQEGPSSVGVLQPYVNSSEGIIRPSLCRGVLTRFAIEIFFLQVAQRKKAKKKYYQQATYEDELPTYPQPSAALVFQEINRLNAIITMRSTYDEPLEVCPRGT